jgi:hypothetical protein
MPADVTAWPIARWWFLPSGGGMTQRADDTADSHVCPPGLSFGADVHETTLRVNVRWVTPLGDETTSTS